jgi:iron(III) transport system ATP-binding protein
LIDVAVALNAVEKRYGARSAVQSMYLEVARGATVGILGPSGSGKTTLLRLIAGLEAPDFGEIYMAGRLASSPGRLHIPPAERNIGFVFQDLALWPHLSVAGNLLFVLESRHWPAERRNKRIEEMLEIVRLSDRAREHPGHLSGGEQQRVALARALVANPDVLLLDEPFSSLDPELRAGLRDELAAIPKKLGLTMIYVTHDRGDIDALGGTTVTLSRSGIIDAR